MVLQFRSPIGGLLICAFTLANASEQAAEAASVTRENGPCQMRLDGPIETDDYTRVQALLETERPSTLCLNSPGGSYAEGLKIIELMLATKKGVSTIVEANRECLSACAFVFLAGHKVHNSGSVPDRTLHISATLGFHGPYVKVSSPHYDPETAKRAQRAGIRAIGRLIALDRKDLFPDGLLALALEKGAKEYVKVEDVFAAGAWRINLFGFQRPSKLTLRMLEQACENYDMWDYWGSGPPDEPGRAYEAVARTRFDAKREVVFKDRRFRFLLDGYGDESAYHCGVDVVDTGPRGPYLSVRLVDFPKDMPRADALRKAVEKGDLSGTTPLWYIFPPTTSLKSLAE